MHRCFSFLMFPAVLKWRESLSCETFISQKLMVSPCFHSFFGTSWSRAFVFVSFLSCGHQSPRLLCFSLVKINVQFKTGSQIQKPPDSRKPPRSGSFQFCNCAPVLHSQLDWTFGKSEPGQPSDYGANTGPPTRGRPCGAAHAVPPTRGRPTRASLMRLQH